MSTVRIRIALPAEQAVKEANEEFGIEFISDPIKALIKLAESQVVTKPAEPAEPLRLRR